MTRYIKVSTTGVARKVRPPASAASIPAASIPDGSDGTAIHDNVSGEIAAVTEKATPVSADLVLIEDSEASNAKKRVQLGNLPGGGSVALDDLTDVTITAPSTGEVVKYNGSAWVNDTDDTGSGSLPTGTTKGDLAVYNGSSWVRLGAGANDTLLTADSGEATGLKWAVGGGSAVFRDLVSLTDTTATTLDTWKDFGSETISFTDPGGAVAVYAEVKSMIQFESSASRRYVAIRVGISFDGGSTFTFGSEQPTELTGGNQRRTHLSAMHLRSGTPTGNVIVKAQIEQRVLGTAGDVNFGIGEIYAEMS